MTIGGATLEEIGKHMGKAFRKIAKEDKRLLKEGLATLELRNSFFGGACEPFYTIVRKE